MSESPALARVGCVVAAAREVVDARRSEGRALRRGLPASTGLSPEGVRLALDEHLEFLAPEADDLARLVARMLPPRPTPRCHVGLAANVCTAALRAITCAAAVAPSVRVRVSRRDPLFATALVRSLAESSAFAEAGGDIALVEALDAAPDDEVHLFGTDEGLAAIESQLPPETRTRRFGTGIGVAWIRGADEAPAAAEALARDVVAFDQQGCLSPRFALVDGSVDQARGVAVALHEALEAWAERVPRGPLTTAERAALASQRQIRRSVGAWWEGVGHAVAFDPEPRVLDLLPPLRAVMVVPASSRGGGASALPGLVGPWARWVTAVGLGSEADRAAIERTFRGARTSALGRMQHPPLDGPVDLRGLVAGATVDGG